MLTYLSKGDIYSKTVDKCFVYCSVRYVGVFTAGLVLYRIGVDYWNMLPHENQYCVCCCCCCYVYL